MINTKLLTDSEYRMLRMQAAWERLSFDQVIALYGHPSNWVSSCPVQLKK